MAERPPALVAVVEERRAAVAIQSLRAEGVYDDERPVQPGEAETVCLPVTAPPADTRVRSVIRQPTEISHRDGLDARLADRGWTATERERAPGSWAVIGDIVLVRIPEDCPRPAEVGEALIELQGASTALAREGIDGPHREPSVSVLAGDGETETVHTEHGTKYALDLTEVMFSPGNKAERVRMGEVVSPSDRVVDMFAGIGYFTLPMARVGATVTAIERNPTAFQYLLENTVLNDVTDAIQPFRADCRDVVDWHDEPSTDVDVTADRVVMGHYDAADYLDAALAILVPGGTLHLHAAVPETVLPDRPLARIEAAAAEAERTVEEPSVRRVKSYSEGVWHVVVTATVA